MMKPSPRHVSWTDDDVEWSARRTPIGDVHLEAKSSEGVLLHTLLPAQSWIMLMSQLSARGAIPVNVCNACALHGTSLKTQCTPVEATPILGYVTPPTVPPALPRAADIRPVRAPDAPRPLPEITEPAPARPHGLKVATRKGKQAPTPARRPLPKPPGPPPPLAPTYPSRPDCDVVKAAEDHLLIEEPTLADEEALQRDAAKKAEASSEEQQAQRRWWPF